MKQRRAGIAVAFALSANILILAAVPAQAGWLWGSDTPPKTVDDQVLAHIQQAIDEERYIDAGTLLDHAISAAGTDPRLTLLAGNLNLARGHYEVALASFKSVDTQPNVRAGALEGEGIAMSLTGHAADALPVLETAVSMNPNAWHAWNALGVLYDRRHDWSKASAAYEHAMSVSGGAAQVLNNRGFSRLSQNRLDDAAADFVTALQKKPDFAPARNNLRLAIAMKGDYARAIEGASSTDRASILNNAGFAAMARGDYSEAENLLGQAIQAREEYYSVAASNLEMVHGLETGSYVNGIGNAPSH
jgi:Flp pilus assembly protein TadD